MRRKKIVICFLCTILVLAVIGCESKKNRESIKVFDFQKKYKRAGDALTFDTTIHVGDGVQNYLYVSKAQLVRFDSEKIMGICVPSKIDDTWLGLDGNSFALDNGNTLNIDEDYVAFNSNSKLEEIITSGFSLFGNEYTADQYPIVEIEKESTASGEIKKVNDTISSMGIEDFRFYKYYVLDDTLPQDNGEDTQNNDITDRNIKASYYIGTQFWQGLPVFCSEYYSGFNDTWAPLQVLFVNDGIEKMQVLYCFQFKKSDEKQQLKSFEEIADSLENEYELLLTDNKHTVTEAELYFWVDSNQIESEFEMKPVWVLTVREFSEGNEDDYIEYQELVDARTAENIETGE